VSSDPASIGLDERLVPGWLQRVAALGWRVLASLALLFIIVQVLILLSTVTAAILIALIIAATFAPYVIALRARGWARTKAAAAVSLLALIVLTATFVILSIAFLPYVGSVVSAIQAGTAQAQDWLNQQGLPPAATELIGKAEGLVRNAVAGAVSELVAPIAAFVTSLILGGFLTFFFLLDGDRAWGWLVAPIDGWRADAISASGRKALDRVGGYLRGTTILSAILAATDFVFLFLLGVPLAGPLSVLVFIAGFIPYIGGLVMNIVILLVTLSSAGSQAALILVVLIAIRAFIIGNFVRPVVYARTIDIHPALVLIALPAGAAMFGILGLFAALPALAAAIALTPAIILALDLEPDLRPVRPGLVPVWLDRLGQWSWRGLVVAGLLAIGIAAAIRIPLVVVPLILAVVLAATLDSSADALRRRGWSRGRAAAAVTAGTVLVITAILVGTTVVMVDQFSTMVDTTARGASQGPLASLGVGDVLHAITSGTLATVTTVVANLSAFGIILLLSTLLTFYLLRDGERAGKAAVARFAGHRRDDLTRAGERAVAVLGGYMVGTGVISLFGAGTTAIIMLILGLPLVLPIAVLSFFLCFIPYIGSFIATALAFLVAIAVGSSTDVVIMAIYTVVFNIVQGNFVAPLVYGRAVSLHPAVVLMAIPAGSAIAGIIGMFLVVPFLGVIAVSWRTILHVFDPTVPDGPEEPDPPGATDAGAPDAPPPGPPPTPPPPEPSVAPAT
jgi:predicted PurR-regulated permease PerM